MEEHSPAQRRKVDPRAVGSDRMYYVLGGMRLPDIGNIDDHPLVVPDQLLPAQWPGRRFDEDAEAWKRLHAAVLIGALDDLAKPTSKRAEQDQRTAIDWLNGCATTISF